MSDVNDISPPSVRSRLVPLVVFVVLLVLTLVVTRQQFLWQRSLQARHTGDVCLQASRRLEFFVDSRLTVAEIFARRWATHETRDFSRQRFIDFGTVILDAMPGYRAMSMIPVGGTESWTVPTGAVVSESRVGRDLARVIADAERRNETVLSPPVADRDDRNVVFFAALPLRRDDEMLGVLVVELDAATLIDACFHHRIRSEFDFEIRDAGRRLYRFVHGEHQMSLSAASSMAQTFPVRNREWTLSMAPRVPTGMLERFGAAVPVFLLGLVLSLVLTGLFHLLQVRAQLFREARDRVVSEMSAREAAQEALTASEARYRSVFDSATDGLVIVNREGVILEANVAACAMHGRPPDSLHGVPFSSLLHRDHHQRWDDLVHQLEEVGASRIDARNVRSDGSAIDLEVRASPLLQGEDDREGRVLMILTDVTERIRAARRHAQLSRKVLAAQEEERGRISRELHDELGQLLTALRLEMGWLKKSIPLQSEETRSTFDACVQLVEHSAEQLRHICRGLRPPLLDDLGLEPAAQLLVDDFADRSGIEVEYHVDLDEAEEPIPAEMALCVYRILQESLTNVSRHARAHKVMISLVRRRGSLVAWIADDGQGFDVNGLGTKQACGIEGMRERAHLVQGTVEIRSGPGKGTRVMFEAPLPGRA